MRMRIVLAMAATVATLVTAGPAPGARAAGRVGPGAAHQGAAGTDLLQPDPGPRLIVLSPGETASADVSFGVAGQRTNSALVYRDRVDVTALARHTRYFP